MDLYNWISIAIAVLVYGIPFGIGVCVSSWRKAVLLGVASFAGLYLTIWTTFGPLFLPLAVQLVPSFELAGILLLSFIGGTIQASLIASAGFAIKRLCQWLLSRRLAARAGAV